MKTKHDVHIRIAVSKDHLEKLQSTGIKNISEVIRRCIDKTPLESIKRA